MTREQLDEMWKNAHRHKDYDPDKKWWKDIPMNERHLWRGIPPEEQPAKNMFNDPLTLAVYTATGII